MNRVTKACVLGSIGILMLTNLWDLRLPYFFVAGMYIGLAIFEIKDYINE